MEQNGNIFNEEELNKMAGELDSTVNQPTEWTKSSLDYQTQANQQMTET